MPNALRTTHSEATWCTRVNLMVKGAIWEWATTADICLEAFSLDQFNNLIDFLHVNRSSLFKY